MENNKSNFKIVAIKTGNKPDRVYEIQRTGAKLDFFKNLSPNKIYSFYNNYSFPQNDFNEIICDNTACFDLYSIKSNGKNIQININAIVGNNGSGKSSLIELLYWANYNIGCISKLLRDGRTNKVLEPYKFLDFEILYTTNEDKLINLIFQEGKILQHLFDHKRGKFTPSNIQFDIANSSELMSFFYSIVVNYSHYALNSLEIGNWIEPLFHKNDGYQTPIVLNPMRTKGIIDINRENGLLKRRLLGNILEPIGNQPIEDSLRNIANNKFVTQLNLEYNSNKPSNEKYREPKDLQLIKKVISSIEKFFDFKLSNYELDEELYVNISLNYIIEKLIKISTTYRPYYKYRGKEQGTLKYIDAFIKKVKESNSHIVFKVKGAIIYLKYYKEIFGDNYLLNKNDLIIDVEELSNKIEIIKQKEFLNQVFLNTFSMVPPGFYNTEILLSDGTSFNSLSSGEKQKIHSVSSIIYHIINLNSVKESFSNEKDGYHQYPFLNIILDEIELYYHPEWQKSYVKDLLKSISNIPTEGINNIEGINITFLTHSPFILSDIPGNNVLKLKKGMPQEYNPEELTFGANINDVLSNEFFLGDGLIGDFAKEKIQGVIDYINYWNRKRININYNSSDLENNIRWVTTPELAKNVIEQIGEPYLSEKLKDMFLEAFPEFKDEEIKKLEDKIEKLKHDTYPN